LFFPASSSQSEPAFRQGFDGPEANWELLDWKSAARIVSQQCVAEGARDASGSARIVAAAPPGESALLHCPTARVAVIPELQVRLWVKCDRPSVRLGVRVVLPRSRDGRGGPPTTVVVRGAAYAQPGHWQQLTLTDVPQLLAAEIRVMRAAAGSAIDSREAYVESVVLVVPGDPRGVEVFTDDLEVEGIVLAAANEVQLANFASGQSSAGAVDSAAGSVELRGGILLLNERPFLARGIEWRGEPLAFLAERGFNVVQLTAPPGDQQIADAQRSAIWFLAVAPRPETLARDGLGRHGDRVLGWLIDDGSTEADPGYARRWAELIRQRDAVAGRPVVVVPELDWRTASHSAEILVAGHPRPGHVSPGEFDAWFARRGRLARAGTPLWASFATQYGEAATQQAAALASTAGTPPVVDPSHVATLVRTASMRGVRGFLFRSGSPLSETDAATRRRAAALELINLRLQLIEPWLAGGKVIGRVASADAAWNGVVLHVDRARLLVPWPASPHASTSGARGPATPAAESELAFLVPGVPESTQVYALSPAGLRTLPAQRVAGGTRIVLPFAAVALITEDNQVVQSIRRQVAAKGPQIVRLERDLVVQRAELLADTAQRLSQLGYATDATGQIAASVSATLRDPAGRGVEAGAFGRPCARPARRRPAPRARQSGGIRQPPAPGRPRTTGRLCGVLQIVGPPARGREPALRRRL
jgi:hypothetical protein